VATRWSTAYLHLVRCAFQGQQQQSLIACSLVGNVLHGFQEFHYGHVDPGHNNTQGWFNWGVPSLGGVTPHCQTGLKDRSEDDSFLLLNWQSALSAQSQLSQSWKDIRNRSKSYVRSVNPLPVLSSSCTLRCRQMQPAAVGMTRLHFVQNIPWECLESIRESMKILCLGD